MERQSDSDRLADAAWFRAAIDRYETPLAQYAARILQGDVDGACDIVQDTFLKLWTADRAEVDGYLAQWLYRVCRNRALDVCRKESRMTTVIDSQLELQVASGSEGASGDGAINASGDETQSIMVMIDALPDRQQEVLRLKFQGGLSYAEIANVMDLTVNHVGVLIHNALRVLREKLSVGGATRQVVSEVEVDAGGTR